jgi:hypothetical protein
MVVSISEPTSLKLLNRLYNQVGINIYWDLINKIGKQPSAFGMTWAQLNLIIKVKIVDEVAFEIKNKVTV